MPSLHRYWKFKPAAQSVCSQPEAQTKWKSLLSFFNGKQQPSSASKTTPSSPPLPESGTHHSWKVADSAFWHCKALTASEALSRALSIPSVYGPAWQTCEYHYDTARFRQPFECGFGISSLSRGSRRETDLRIDVKGISRRCLDSKLKLSSPSRVIWKGGDSRREDRLHEETQKVPGTNFGFGKQSNSRKVLRISLRASHSGNGEDRACGDNRAPVDNWNSGFRRASQRHHLLKGSAAYHFFRSGSGLPVVGELFVKTVIDASCGGAALVPPGLVSESSQDRDRSEDGVKQTDKDLKNLGLRLLSGACCLPHPAKEKTGGEDAYFICPDEQAIGVADGVGGWADVGVDAGAYARELMSQSMIAVRQEPRGFIDPARVLETAHSKTTCRGSSTACILALSDYGLQAANLGDSGFVIVRNGRTIFKSPAQQHQFNIPFQLENGGSDPPSAAEVFTLQVAVGDVIVAGTDGLFDNVYDNELSSVVVHSIRAGMSPEVTAQKIASLARSRAQDRNRQTPFSIAAQDAGFRFYGGKMDDITVVVSYITSSKSVQ